MNFRIFIIILCALALSACSFFPHHKRQPANVQVVGFDLVEKSQSILDKVASREINSQNCSNELNLLIEDYSKAPALLNVDVMKNQGQEILDQSFEARLALHSMLELFPGDCKLKVRELYLKMRLAEDFVGVHFYSEKQISAQTLKYQEEPVPLVEVDKYHPYHLNQAMVSGGKFEFKNGDIMITKGVSFISSTISELATPKSLFSHIAFIHVDENTKVVTTIESYVGRGVDIFPIDEALKNENARILILRSKDLALASAAANYMFDKVMKLKEKKKVIFYDYQLDFSDNTKLSCEEVAYDAFKTASNGKVLLPELESQIVLNDPKFLKRVGVKAGPMMVPTDMETDSRFDVVLDWTDNRVMRDSWRKDALLGEMFRWIQDYNYRIHENVTSAAAKVIWSTRNVPGLWGMLSKASGIPSDFTKDVPGITIATMASLKAIGGELLPIVTKADQEYFEKNGRWMTKSELSLVLDEYRQTNPKKLRKVFRD